MGGGGGPAPTKAGKKPLDAAINLVPFIDLLSCCISFLLITAVWTQLAAIDVTPSDRGGAQHETATAAPPPPRARLHVDPSGYTFVAPGGRAERVDGSDDRLRDHLAAARRAAPDAALSIEVSDGTPYGRALHAVDLAHAASWRDVGFDG